jgi:hypothetical protein
LELETFSSKVRVAEVKLVVATEENDVHNEGKIPNSSVISKGMVDQILGVDHQVESISEEETKAFMPKRRSFWCLKRCLKKMSYC